MKELVHGGDIYTAREQQKNKTILDFSANINPLGLPDSVKEAAVRGVAESAHYPDPLCRKLRSAIARAEGVPESSIVTGNGAADIIVRLVMAKMPYRAMVLAPTFAEYEAALTSVGCLVQRYYLSEGADFSLSEAILEEIGPSLDMLFLCNPNNPTGQLISPELLHKILWRCEETKTLLLLDECFIDFTDDPEGNSLKARIGQYKLLFLLKAFTKTYAMPGLRLGYGICGDAALVDVLWNVGQPWSVSLPAQLAGIAALDESEYLTQAQQMIESEKRVLADGLRRLGFRVWQPAANYVFFRREAGDSRDLRALLLEEGILIRSCENYPGLDNRYYRVAVKKPEENQQLLSALAATERERK